MAEIGNMTYTITIKESVDSANSIVVMELGRWFDNNNENGDEENRIKNDYINLHTGKIVVIESDDNPIGA